MTTTIVCRLAPGAVSGSPPDFVYTPTFLYYYIFDCIDKEDREVLTTCVTYFEQTNFQAIPYTPTISRRFTLRFAYRADFYPYPRFNDTLCARSWSYRDRCLQCGKNFTRPHCDVHHAGLCRRHRKVRDQRSRGFSPHASLGDYVFDTSSAHRDWFGLTPPVLKAIAGSAPTKMQSQIVNYVEDVLLLFGTLSGCSTPLSAVSAVLTYAKTHFSKSIVAIITEYLSCLVIAPQADSDPDAASFSETMQWLKSNWRNLVSSKFFGHVSKILGVIVLAGFCEASKLTMDVKGIKLIEPDLMKEHHNAFDLCDAVMSTVVFFTESCYACWTTGSIKPLLFGASFADQLTEDYNKCCTWWSLVQNGNLERQVGKSDTDFFDLIQSVGGRLRTLAKESRGIDKAMIERKLLELAKIESDFCTMKLGSRIRKAPFVIELVGGSAQGKSTLMDQLVQAMLVSAGLDSDPKRRGVVNASEAFMSTWFSNMNVMIIDDFGQENPETTKTNPCRLLLDVCNNAIYIANKADLHQKGKVFVEPDIVVLTTNVMDLNAYAYAQCPYAIQRRPNLVIEVEAIEKYQDHTEDGISLGLSPAKVSQMYEEKGVVDRPEIEDLWELTVHRAVQPCKLVNIAHYEVVKHDGKPIERKSFPEMLPVFLKKFHDWRHFQEQLVANAKKESKLKRCSVSGCVNLCGFCAEHDSHPHFGEMLGEALTRSTNLLREKVSRECFGVLNGLDVGAASLTLAGARYFCWHTRWLQMVPTPWTRSNWFRNLYMVMNYDRIKRFWIYGTATVAISTVAGCFAASRTMPLIPACGVSGGLIGAGVWSAAHMSQAVKSVMVRELEHKNAVSSAVQEWRDVHGSNLCKSAAFIAAIYGAAKLYRYFTQETRLEQAPRSERALEPQVQEMPIVEAPEVPTNAAKAENAWAKVERVLPYPKDTASWGVMPDDLLNVIRKNLFHAQIKAATGKVYGANVIFVTSNAFLLPRHYFLLGKTFDVILHSSKPETSGGSFRTTISEATSVFLDKTDMCLCYSPTGGSFKNIVQHFPPAPCAAEVPFKGLFRKQDGGELDFVGKAKPAFVSNNSGIKEIDVFAGGYYEGLSLSTFPGMCGAPIVTYRKGSKILGLHVGGIENTPKGCYAEITQTAINAAIEKLKRIEGVSLTTQFGELPTEFLKKPIWVDGPIDPHSPLCYLPDNACIPFYGKCLGKVQPTTEVARTVMSKTIEEVCGVPNKWGPPKIRPTWEPFQKCLSNLSVPCRSFQPELVIRAVKDYKRDIVALVKQSKEFSSETPLSDKDNINGIPGKKFIDGMVLSTSAGFPFSGKKSQFIIDMDAIGQRELTPEAQDLLREANARLKRGERMFGIAKACTKDEVLPVAKGKCRIFYSSAFTTIFLARKYFLPVLRVLQLNPALSECAVGSNCHGPDWEALMKHSQHFGTDRLIAGDYSKYDQTLPAQLLIAALRILVDIAREMNYSPEDLSIMEALIGDLVYPLINFNGDMITLLEGGWISGVPMTVHVNGICGSILMRIVFFLLYPKADEFRPFVKLLTYGDDNIGSVAKGYELFNIKHISQILGKYGMVYTMPDKESELVDFLPLKDLEFLKRKSVYIEEIGVHAGALAEDSIFKSLHCFLRSAKDDRLPAERCGEVIDGALREWFFHGRTTFDQRHAEMLQVVKRHGFEPWVRTLDHSFNSRVEEWRRKYDPRYALGEAVDADVTKATSNADYGCGVELEPSPQNARSS